MKLFRDMSENEVQNSTRSLVFGFYVFLLLLALNNVYHLINNKDLMSSFSIFTIGLVLTFGYEFILNMKKSKKA
ncbi:DUF2871 family protein [Jeotgalibacillus salarius]|uniref:DUF2871 family protein n=1 Tax=Jeotgalibacillus salarius TaxID=546023 RepID=A0A4Y8LG27_9BACL|nr:DUF2871 family protein [Jeotgalibacillus salarius]TFD99466.1 DUF2871 family protein [Jeotgalibacillus salarius]